MDTQNGQPARPEIFFCYAREDEELRQGLEKQLRALRRQGLINVWHDREIKAGTDWEHEIDKSEIKLTCRSIKVCEGANNDETPSHFAGTPATHHRVTLYSPCHTLLCSRLSGVYRIALPACCSRGLISYQHIH